MGCDSKAFHVDRYRAGAQAGEPRSEMGHATKYGKGVSHRGGSRVGIVCAHVHLRVLGDRVSFRPMAST